MFQSAPEGGRERKREGRRRGRERRGEKKEKKGENSHRIYPSVEQTANLTIGEVAFESQQLLGTKRRRKEEKRREKKKEKREGGRGKEEGGGPTSLQKFRGLRPRTPHFSWGAAPPRPPLPWPFWSESLQNRLFEPKMITPIVGPG